MMFTEARFVICAPLYCDHSVYVCLSVGKYKLLGMGKGYVTLEKVIKF